MTRDGVMCAEGLYKQKRPNVKVKRRVKFQTSMRGTRTVYVYKRKRKKNNKKWNQKIKESKKSKID